MISAACSGVSSYPFGSPLVSPSAASSYEESFQDTSAQETSAQETSAQETDSQETSAQETTFQEASVQETSAQETESQETFALAVSSQLTESKAGSTSPVGSALTNWLRAPFGFGGFRTSADLPIWSSPTPTEPAGVSSTGLVATISAPL